MPIALIMIGILPFILGIRGIWLEWHIRKNGERVDATVVRNIEERRVHRYGMTETISQRPVFSFTVRGIRYESLFRGNTMDYRVGEVVPIIHCKKNWDRIVIAYDQNPKALYRLIAVIGAICIIIGINGLI